MLITISWFQKLPCDCINIPLREVYHYWRYRMTIHQDGRSVLNTALPNKVRKYQCWLAIRRDVALGKGQEPTYVRQ
jgi:hypothetical protein